MNFKELVYSRTKNLGNYESERVELRAELDENETVEATFNAVKSKVLQLQKVANDSSVERPLMSQDEKVKPLIPEDRFGRLKWKSETGSVLKDYEIALIQDNDEKQWRHCFNILQANNATISNRFHEEAYRFSYWLYSKMDYKIFRQQLKEPSK